MKYTPGPWKVQGSKTKFYITTQTSNEIFSIKPESAEGRFNFEHNLSIIAASPDMYEALNDIMAWAGTGLSGGTQSRDYEYIISRILDHAVKAIKLAEGK